MHLDIRFSKGILMRFLLNGDYYVVERFVRLVENIKSGCENQMDYVSNFLWTTESYPLSAKLTEINQSIRYFNENNGYDDELRLLSEVSRSNLNALHLAFEHAANRYLPNQLLSSDHNQEIEKRPPRCPDLDQLAFHLNNINSLVHSLESSLSLSDSYVNAYLSTYLRDLTKETKSIPLLESDYELFSLDAKFGDLFLGYGTTGKNLFHLYNDNDLSFLSAGNHPSPQRAITSNILVWFSENKEHKVEYALFIDWCKENNLGEYGFEPESKKNSVGYIKLGEYVPPPKLIGASKQQIVDHYAGLEVLDYYITA